MMDQSFLEAFAEVIKESVARKNTVEVEGLGAFTHDHRKQFQQHFDNGKVVMMPPEDKMVFTAAKTADDAD